MLIRHYVLEFILGVSREVHPKEFSCHLRGDNDTIEEVIVLPKTVYGNGFSRIMMNMKPIDKTIIGSAHSHPNKSYKPSIQDLNYFSRFGYVHLIIRYPYKSIHDVAAYDRDGNRIPIKVIH